MYKTNFTAVAGRANGHNILGAGTIQYRANDNEFYKSMLLLHYLQDKKSIEEIEKFSVEKNIESSIFTKLIDHKLITRNPIIFDKDNTMDFKNNLYIENIVKNSEEVIARIKNTTFVIVGCGGIGNFMAFALNTYSPRKIILIDGDKIENSNLNRQLMFTEGDIGKYKSFTLKNALMKRNSIANIESINEYVNEEILSRKFEKIYDNSDQIITILSGDNEVALTATTKVCAKYSVPFLNIGYLNNISTIGPFYIPNVSCCPYCHNSFSVELDSKKDELDDWIDELNKNSEAPSSFVNNALASSMAMSDIIHYLDNDLENINSLNCRFGIENMGFESLQIKSSIDRNCKYCGGYSHDYPKGT